MTYFYVSPQGQKYQFTVTERIDQTALQKDPSEPILINPKDPEHPILIKAMSRDLHFSQDGQSVEAGLNLNIIFLVVVAVVYTVLIWKLCGDFIR